MNNFDHQLAHAIDESQAAYKVIERLEHVHDLDLCTMFEAFKVDNRDLMRRLMEKLLANEQQIADARRSWRKLHDRAMAAVHPAKQPNPHLVEELKQAGAI